MPAALIEALAADPRLPAGPPRARPAAAPYPPAHDRSCQERISAAIWASPRRPPHQRQARDTLHSTKRPPRTPSARERADGRSPSPWGPDPHRLGNRRRPTSSSARTRPSSTPAIPCPRASPSPSRPTLRPGHPRSGPRPYGSGSGTRCPGHLLRGPETASDGERRRRARHHRERLAAHERAWHQRRLPRHPVVPPGSPTRVRTR